MIDEAHNLVERGRQMYSAELCKEDFLCGEETGKGRSTAVLQKDWRHAIKILLAMKKRVWETIRCWTIFRILESSL